MYRPACFTSPPFPRSSCSSLRFTRIWSSDTPLSLTSTFPQVILLQPEVAEAHANLASVFKDATQHDVAIPHYRYMGVHEATLWAHEGAW